MTRFLRRLSHTARWHYDFEHGTSSEKAHAGLRLAEIAHDAGEFDRAERFLRTVCQQRDPIHAPRAAFTLGQMLTELGPRDAANLAFAFAGELSRPALTPDVHLNLGAR